MKQGVISFVIPCYRSEHTIALVVDEIIRTVATKPSFDYEIIAVNDCSPDGVFGVLKEIASQNPKLKVVSLGKNMGKHAAVLAGYAIAQGEYIVDLDDDYQSPVFELWRLMEPLFSGECDYSTARYEEKKQSRFKNFGSNINLLMSVIMLDKPRNLRFENFSAMRYFVCKEIIKYRNPYPYLEGLVLRVTRRIKTVEMKQRERADNNSTGFTFKKSLSLWFNGLTAFSVKPLRAASLIGFLFSMFGFALGVITVVRRIFNPEIAAGYSSLLAAIVFTNGVVMLLLGLIGEYLGRIYICINDSPQYVIRDTINIEPEEGNS